MDLIPPLLPSLSHQLGMTLTLSKLSLNITNVEQYLLQPELLPIHDTGPAQQHWRRTPEPMNILHTEVCGRQHAITVVRDPCTGEVRDFVEQRLAMGDTGTTAKNSSSMKRALAPPDSSFRGSAANYPFWPGGMELPEIGEEVAIDELDFSPDKLLHCPPGIEMKAKHFNG